MCFNYRYSLSYIPFVRFVFKNTEGMIYSSLQSPVGLFNLCLLLSREAILKLVAVVLK